ncbi:MAG: glycosyltransferase [Euryarchaeota archaeon]|nr:glycosyltransferase [Euryarchaeota archaeon]
MTDLQTVRPTAKRSTQRQDGRGPDPLLSVVVLTLDEADNLEEAVSSLIDQDGVPLEVLIVDGDSKDGTVGIAERLEAHNVGRVRLVTSEPLPIGPARNLGLSEARAPFIAFMSADATAAPGWAKAMVKALEKADIVYGRQEHTPPKTGVTAVVRGLRYHHFNDDTIAAPETFASNVNAAIRREVFDLLTYVDEGPASALDDILFTHEAKELGLRVAYQPSAVVRHKDATTLAGEYEKNRREGYGWGILAPKLGTHRTVLAWGAGLLVGAGLLAARPGWWTGAVLAGVLWAPALRRVVRGGGPYLRRAPASLAGAFVVSPLFDLAFLLAYVRGLSQRRPELTGRIPPQGARS